MAPTYSRGCDAGCHIASNVCLPSTLVHDGSNLEVVVVAGDGRVGRRTARLVNKGGRIEESEK